MRGSAKIDVPGRLYAVYSTSPVRTLGTGSAEATKKFREAVRDMMEVVVGVSTFSGMP